MLNAIGLQNVGVQAFLDEKLPRLSELGATVIANVWGDTEEEYVAVDGALEDAAGLAAIELNISCPNVKQDGACPALFGDRTAHPRRNQKGSGNAPEARRRETKSHAAFSLSAPCHPAAPRGWPPSVPRCA